MVLLRISTLLAIIFQVYGSSSPIPCGLKWSAMTTAGVDVSSVSSHGEELYVAKVVRNGTHVIGTLEKGSLRPFFANSESGITGILLLNNFHNCTVSFIGSNNWQNNAGFLVPKSDEHPNTDYVGRGLISTGGFYNKWMAGVLNVASGKFIVDGVPNSSPIEASTFELLQSTSPGLILEVTNFVFDTDGDGEGTKDVAGIEIIQNQSDATVEQTVTHTKNVTEIYRTTITKNYVATRTTVTKKRILFYTKTTTTTEVYTDQTTETTEHRETTLVQVTKRIVVPPFESVEACSEITIKEEADVPYTAIGRYTAPGLSPQQVLQILTEDGVQNGKIVGDEVQITILGTFSYKLALTTNFKVNPYGVQGGCTQAVRPGMKLKV